MRPFRGLRGQTLLQLAAAMAIVAVAITLAIPAYRGSRLKAYLAEVRQIAGAWKKEALSYHVRTGLQAAASFVIFCFKRRSGVRTMKLSNWARRNGVSYLTAWRWFRKGMLPVPARQLPTGTILVDEPPPPGKTVIYARVSSSDQKDDLERQVARLRTWAEQWGVHVDGVVTEIGSGMNGKRRKLVRLLRDSSVGLVVVEHRDRLARFGFDLVEAALLSANRRVAVVDPGEVTDDIVQDMYEVLTSLCARLYGRRSARNRAARAVRAATEP